MLGFGHNDEFVIHDFLKYGYCVLSFVDLRTTVVNALCVMHLDRKGEVVCFVG